MANANILAPHFIDADKAREYLEALRWPNGPVCPHCGVVRDHYALAGKAHRPGLWKCKDCRKQFSVTVNTVFAGSKIPLNKWLLAVHLMCASKKAVSSHQIHRMLGITYKSAWFMTHRIREAMKSSAKRGLRISISKNTALFHKLPNGRIGLLAWYPNAKQGKKSSGNRNGDVEASDDDQEGEEEEQN